MRRDGFVLASQHYFETQVSAAARMLTGLPPSRPQPLRLSIDPCFSVFVCVCVCVYVCVCVCDYGYGCRCEWLCLWLWLGGKRPGESLLGTMLHDDVAVYVCSQFSLNLQSCCGWRRRTRPWKLPSGRRGNRRRVGRVARLFPPLARGSISNAIIALTRASK